MKEDFSPENKIYFTENLQNTVWKRQFCYRTNVQVTISITRVSLNLKKYLFNSRCLWTCLLCIVQII